MRSIFLRLMCRVIVALNTTSSFGTELVLNEGEIIDLGSAKTGTKTFLFDQVSLKNKSLILIPASLRSVNISINELRSSGTSYIFVYDDMGSRQLPSLTNRPKAGTCEKGANGASGENGIEGYSGLDLNLTLGFSSLGKVVLLNQGLQGGQGQNGGNGQEGGDSGGKERCVIQRCHGGNGGDNGAGGSGGNGGKGGNVSLNYSGLEPQQIFSITHGEMFVAGLSKDLIGVTLREKKIDGYPESGKGLNLLIGMLGQAMAVEARREADSHTSSIALPENSLEKSVQPGLSVVIAGGHGGSGGAPGSSPGRGGAGYRCTIGPDQDIGADGNWTYSFGPTGVAGQAGNLTKNKLD